MKRRAILTTAPAALAVTAVPGLAGAISQVEPRSEILDLYRRWCEANAISASEADLRGYGDETPLEVAAQRRSEKLRVRLMQYQPQTMPEIAAMLHILWDTLRYMPHDMGEPSCDDGAPLILASIWRGASGREGVPT